MLIRVGEFVTVGKVILTTFRDFDWCTTSFAQDGELHFRRLPLRRVVEDPELEWSDVLAPSDSVQALDRAVQENQPHLDRLKFTFLGLNLFFQENEDGAAEKETP
jgi:hypothetical protein